MTAQTGTSRSIYLDSIAYRLGERECDILNDRDQGIDIEWCDLLLKNGMKKYFVTDRSCLDLAHEAICDTLALSTLPTEAIDALVFTTCSFRSAVSPDLLDDNNSSYFRYVKTNLLKGIELKNADYFGTFLTESGNFISLIRAATNLIKAEGKKNILCVNADKIPTDPAQRRGAHSGVMTNSDVGVAFIVSSESGQYKVEGLGQVFSPYLNTLGRGTQFQKQVEIMRGICNSSEKTLAAAGHSIADYSALIINNYSQDLMRQFATYMQFPVDILFTENLPKFAHAFTADNPINLSMLGPKLASNSLIFMLSVGTTNWGTCSLKKL